MSPQRADRPSFSYLHFDMLKFVEVRAHRDRNVPYRSLSTSV